MNKTTWVFLFILVFISCSQNKVAQNMSKAKKVIYSTRYSLDEDANMRAAFAVIKIDSCEYIYVPASAFIIHKANCSNPTHKH